MANKRSLFDGSMRFSVVLADKESSSAVADANAPGALKLECFTCCETRC